MKKYLTNGGKCYIIHKCKVTLLYTIGAILRKGRCFMAKDLRYGMLLDVYGSLLTDKQLDMMQLYYDEDLSLSEIGEMFSISRQGVHDSIKRSETALDEFEEHLGILKARQTEIDALLSIKHDALEALEQCRKVSFGRNIAERVIKTLENIDSRLAELGEEQEEQDQN